MKFEYPITANYIRDWTPIHALREFGANTLDGETRSGAKATITYEAKTKKLLFKNENTTVSREALLLGGTANANRDDTIGTYGEGMKMGFLVCAREGLIVTVRNGTEERWAPSIAYSEKWGAQVLQLDVTRTKRQVETFEIEIIGVTMDLWDELQSVFLVLRPPQQSVRVPSGTIMADAEMVGRIYSRGVLIMTKPGLSYGYDLNGLMLNRDRKFAEDVDPYISSVWQELVIDRPDKLAELYEMLDVSGAEGNAFKYGLGGNVSKSIADRFKEMHPDTYIARNTDESKRFEHYGVRSFVPGPALYYVLSGYIDNFEDFNRTHRYDINKIYAYTDLDESEREVYQRSIALLRAASVIKADEMRVTVVDFKDPKIKGTSEGEEIKISKSILRSFGRTTMYLIHEYAHDNGADGEKGHVDAMHEATVRVFNTLAAQSRF